MYKKNNYTQFINVAFKFELAAKQGVKTKSKKGGFDILIRDILKLSRKF